MDTWHISGPAFLSIYGVLIAAVIVIGVGWKAWQTGPGAKAAGPGSRRLGVYHLAYLTAGRPRVCETAVASLLDGGYLRTNSKGELTQVSQQAPRDPVEMALYAGARSRRARELVSVLERPCQALADDLAAAGYLVPTAATRRRRRVTFMLAVLVALVGLARLIAGMANEKPVEFLFVAFIVADLVAIVSFLILRTARPDVVTGAGGKMVTGARRGDRSALPLAVGSGVAVAVAVAGLSAFPDEQIVSALGSVPQQASFSGYSGDGGSSSSCSSSSCGGSSCGGGGGCGG